MSIFQKSLAVSLLVLAMPVAHALNDSQLPVVIQLLQAGKGWMHAQLIVDLQDVARTDGDAGAGLVVALFMVSIVAGGSLKIPL